MRAFYEKLKKPVTFMEQIVREKKNHCMRHPYSYSLTTHDRYLYQGQEMDDEVKGEGNSVNYSFRMHDSRLGRWLTIDPLAKELPETSPYIFTNNNPVIFVDPDGKRFYFAAGGGNDAIAPSHYSDLFGREIKEAGIKGFTQIEGHSTGPHDKILKKILGTWEDGMTSISSIGETPLFNIKEDNKYLADFNTNLDDAINGIKKDLIDNPLMDGEQFNLSGYSYGSVLMAQAAIKILEEGDVACIDNLVLIGSPINPNSELGLKLKELENDGKIGKVIYKSSENDNAKGLASKRGISRFVSILEIFNSGRIGNYDEGHLKFAGYEENEESNEERNKIATELSTEGVE